MISEAINIDCMEYMKGLPDKFFDLAIVDPPYGVNIGNAAQGKWTTSRMQKKDWDKHKPDGWYFLQLRRVSVNQIIWGGNYYGCLSDYRCYIVWDKGAGFRNRDFAECEMAVTSFDRNAKVFSHDPLAKGDYHNGKKIHPTQKPIALYRFCLENFAKAGDKIFDSHLGSGSSRIAAYDLGFDFVGTELDKDYFNAQEERFARHIAQPKLFAPTAEPMEQGLLI